MCSSTIVCRQEQQSVFSLSLSFFLSFMFVIARKWYSSSTERIQLYDRTNKSIAASPSLSMYYVLPYVHCCQLFAFSWTEKKITRRTRNTFFLSLLFAFCLSCYTCSINYWDKCLMFRQVIFVNEYVSRDLKFKKNKRM